MLGMGILTAISVYPRVCGGSARHSDSWKRRKGLSPRVRGKP